jgi:hypothetical protein
MGPCRLFGKMTSTPGITAFGNQTIGAADTAVPVRALSSD